jgi:hypothetical protein
MTHSDTVTIEMTGQNMSQTKVKIFSFIPTGENMSTRRQFMMTLVPAAAVLTAATGARAQAAKIDEKDPAAVALAYKHDATKVDAKANPTYKAGNNCLNCQFYQGKDAWGACPMVGGKLVAGKGWCKVWAKKA